MADAEEVIALALRGTEGRQANSFWPGAASSLARRSVRSLARIGLVADVPRCRCRIIEPVQGQWSGSTTPKGGANDHVDRRYSRYWRSGSGYALLAPSRRSSASEETQSGLSGRALRGISCVLNHLSLPQSRGQRFT